MRYGWIGILFFASQTAWAGAVDSLHGFLDSTRTFRADFTQTVVAKNGKRPQQSSGVMILSRPGKFRWQIAKPYAQLLVGDGEKVWMYDPDLKQVTVRKAGAALGGTPAALLAGGEGGRSTLEKNFTLREGGERQGLAWVEAVPKNSENGFSRLRIGFAGNELKAMEVDDNFGQTTLLNFSNVEHNPPIAPGLLRFTPPAGADVIGE